MKKIYLQYRKYILENFLTTMFSSFFMTSFVQIILNRNPFYWLNYAKEVNIVGFILIWILFFLGIVFIGKKKNLKKRSAWALVLSTIVFSLSLLVNYEDLYFTAGIIFFNAIIIFYVFNNVISIHKIKISDKLLLAIISIGFIIFTYFLASHTIMRYQGFGASTYDFGIFAQMFEYLAKIGRPLTTLERDGLLSHFAVHFSPIFYLFLPGYWIFRCPEYLLVIQAMFIFSGVYPIYLLAKQKKIDNIFILLLAFIYLLYPSLTSGGFFDFHENKFLTALLLWMVYFLESKQKIPMIIFMFLSLMVKEDAALYVIFIGLYKTFNDRKTMKKGLFIFLVGMIYFLLAITIIKLYGGEIMSDRYNNYFTDNSGGLFDLIKTTTLNIGFMFSQIFNQRKFEFLLWMLLPVVFIPFMNKKISNLLLLAPILVMNLMPGYVYQYSPDFQYTYGVVALIFYIMILNVADMKHKTQTVLLVLSFVSALYLDINLNYSKFITYQIKNMEPHNQTRACLDILPKDATITATTYLTPYLSKYDEVYMYPSRHKTDYMVVDLRNNENVTLITELENKGYYEKYNCGYVSIYFKEHANN
ncbi:MAG: DUF2079 domain-containing protein [Mollicutes bacterium]|nr:DUF2079 domain-containing protein [Mollicutes bacterium]